MSHLDEWQIFSARYGVVNDSGWQDKQPWVSRHVVAAEPSLHRCVCPGSAQPVTDREPCALRATQEDFLCNECRQWCVAIDRAGNYHQFASLIGAVPVGDRGRQG